MYDVEVFCVVAFVENREHTIHALTQNPRTLEMRLIGLAKTTCVSLKHVFRPLLTPEPPSIIR